jgi:hypothetical protein
VCATALALAAPGLARAQVVRGVVVDEASGRPIPGAVVVLLDSAGARLAAVLAGDDGRYAVRTTLPGRYGIRAERIGFRASAPRQVTLRTGETIDLRLASSPIPVVLGAVRVTGRTACVARASDGRDVSTVWEEARKALNATDLTQRQELFSARVARFVRTLDAKTQRVTGHTTTEASGVTRNPFVSFPAAQLSAEGFVRQVGSETIYYAPDAGVLLSDEFLNDHCFRLRSGEGPRSGLIGLAFEPVRGRDKPEIEGTLWIDRRSAELRDLEFSYRSLPNLPRSVSSEDFGGRIEFQRMPTGAWIVQRWVIRMPALVDRGPFAERSGALPGMEASRVDRVELGAIREEGGEVLETTAHGARRELAAERAEVRGVVFDSSRMAPLAGARVFLDGTQFSTQSSSSGEFTLGGVPEGTYTISVVHARFDSLGIRAPGQEVALKLGEPATVRLAGPSNATILAGACPADNHAVGMAAVRGRVRDAATGDPVPNAEVAVSWNDAERVAGRVGATQQRRGTRTDAEGRYVLCALPEGTQLALRAASENRRSIPAPAQLQADVLSLVDLVIGGPVAVAASEIAPVEPRREAGPAVSNRTMREAERRRLSDLLRSMPGVSIVPDGSGEPIVELRGGTRFGLERVTPASAPVDSGAPRAPTQSAEQLTQQRCPAAFQIDGIPYEQMKIDSDVQPAEIELIEVYSSALVPVEYSGRSRRAACGLVLIWTRAFAERSDSTPERDGPR